MIRRFYVLPLRPSVTPVQVEEMVAALRATDAHIPGLLESSAGLDLANRTVVWENLFVDEAAYAGPYMVHPYHAATLDDYVMADSPLCLTQDIYATRYHLPGEPAELRTGIRRLVLMNLAEGADTSALESLAQPGPDVATSVLARDDVGWVSAKGRPWTHIWEQAFTDSESLQRYLRSPGGVASSSLEGLRRHGVEALSVKVLTFPFDIKPVSAQLPTDPPPDDVPLMYTVTARLSPDDVDPYVDLLERLYDPVVAASGGHLVQRWRTVEQAYVEAEVHSTWQLESFAAFSAFRISTYADPSWNRFVSEAMPLVKSGTRRFSRALGR
jgi:hypothetical protein